MEKNIILVALLAVAAVRIITCSYYLSSRKARTILVDRMSDPFIIVSSLRKIAFWGAVFIFSAVTLC